MTDVIELLITRQREAGETDAEFASRLGLSRQGWQKLRTRETSLGPRSIIGILTAYPDLRDSVSDFLRVNASKVKQKASLQATMAGECDGR